ncbi:MAG: hypothetical protein HY869_21115 [Chloroflexi bacterium]|nr:hypothetical protein [Chloroflexota bacterium]
MSRDIHAPIEHKEDDLLGRHLLAERIYSRLCRDDCPQAIGVYGGWGTGKTSLLRLLQEIHKKINQSALHIEYIDAWQYENSGDLFVPIIVKLMAKRTDANPDLATYLNRVSFAVLYMGTDLLLRHLTGLDLSDVKGYKEDIEANESNHITPLMWENITDKVEETSQAMEKLTEKVNQGLKTKKKCFPHRQP